MTRVDYHRARRGLRRTPESVKLRAFHSPERCPSVWGVPPVSDLLAKLEQISAVDVAYMVGVVESDGLARARRRGVTASAEGVDWLLRQDELPDMVFEATSAYVHRAPRRATPRPASGPSTSPPRRSGRR